MPMWKILRAPPRSPEAVLAETNREIVVWMPDTVSEKDSA